MRRPWSLERRLVLVLGGVLSLLWLAATVATLVLTRQEIGEVFDSALQETAQRLLPLAVHDLKEAADHDGDDDADESESLSAEFDDSDAYLTYQVRNAMGRVLLRSHDAPAEGFDAPLARGFATVGHFRIYTEASRDGRFFVQVAETGARRDMLIREALIWLIIPLIALVLAAVIAVTLIVRSATRPVLRLQEEIRSRDGANLAPLPEHPLPDELQPIVDAVNRLLARLKRAIAAERSFTAHSAHELRTPIAAAQAQAQLLFDSTQDPSGKQRARNLLTLLSRLGRLVEKLLQLSRAEAGVGSAGASDLREVVDVVIDEYRNRLTGVSAPVELREDGTPAERIAIDPDALGIVLHNLIDNAITHGPPGRPVTVTLGPGARLSIVNEGDAIPAEELPRLRERFVRGRTEAEGSGLGLSIVETIMHEAGGSLSIRSPATGRTGGFEAILSFRELKIASAPVTSARR